MTPEQLVKQQLELGERQESYGEFANSREKFAKALEACEKYNLPSRLTAVVRSRLAVNAANRGDNAAADSMFQAALAAFESDAVRDVLELAECLNHYAHLLRSQKQWAAAIDNYAKAYLLYREITSLPPKDVQQRRLALRNSLKSTAEQSDDAWRDELRARVRDMLPRKDSSLFP